jgi:hypothetical protein
VARVRVVVVECRAVVVARAVETVVAVVVLV